MPPSEDDFRLGYYERRLEQLSKAIEIESCPQAHADLQQEYANYQLAIDKIRRNISNAYTG